MLHKEDRVMSMPPVGTAPEAAVSSVATKWGMGGGTISSVYGWLASNEAVILVGLFVTVAGFVVNLIYQHKRHRRETDEALFRRNLEEAEEKRRVELHRAKMHALLHEDAEGVGEVGAA